MNRLLALWGMALARLRSHGAGPTAPSHCSRWGCLLPVGKASQWGQGPLCDVCRYGLRPVAFPPLSENPLTPEASP